MPAATFPELMHLEFLVEEVSAERALRALLPKIVGGNTSFDIHAYQGKRDLLSKLPSRLRGYRHWIAATNTKVVVLVDEDRQDCHQLKAELEKAAVQAGFTTKTTAGAGQPFAVLNRILVEELEAWFFGDCEAIRAAYPRVPVSLQNRRRFRNPDAIAGGTWEQLDRVLQRAGYHQGGLAKTVAASEIAALMDPARNRSTSFQHFLNGLQALMSS